MNGGAAGAAAAAIAAKKKREEERREEEILTRYNKDDLEGREFKILRSATGAFKRQDYVQKIREEEARAGWEMLEKFDNNRIRFKRPIEKRSMDSHLDFDPYRTSVGFPSGALVAVIIGVAVLVFGVVLAIVYMTGNM